MKITFPTINLTKTHVKPIFPAKKQMKTTYPHQKPNETHCFPPDTSGERQVSPPKAKLKLLSPP
jgi:hypothetical protein